MSIDRKRFKNRAFLATLFFLITIFMGVLRFVQVLRTDTLPVTSIISISADIFCMVLGYVLFICCVVDKGKNEENLNCYLLLLFVCFCSAFLDERAWLVDGKTDLIHWNCVINTLYYMCAPILAFLFWRYVLTYLGIKHRILKRINLCLAIGLLAAIAIRVANVFTGFYFRIKDDGFYERGSMYLLSNLYSYTAMVITLLLVFRVRKHLKSTQVVTLLLYALVPLTVGIVTVFTYGLSLSSAIIMLVLLLMYCVLNVIQSREQSIASNELHMANAIQEGMLPHNFPAYPERTEFDLYASMTPAKEVGGDFYDFYMPDEDHLVITIADVSGKGVPAALLMMVTKTLLKNRGLSGFRDCSRILSLVNNQLCEANLDMFVTVWLGVLQLSTGELTYANAGHEYPAICRAGAEFELFKDRHSPPIGCMEGVPYREQSMKLAPGDILYIYTDGVTEASNRAQEFFGEKGLLGALNAEFDGTMAGLDESVRSHVRKHMNGATQFDDITMLGLKYNGPKSSGKEAPGRELVTRANVEELDAVMAFADAALEEAGCPPKVQVQIDVAVEEIFVNIAQYAYAPEEGQARIVVTPDEDEKGVSILFEDQGKPYDPLSHEDPDTTLSADEREIGGLGIFMVKKSMDDVSYEYSDGKNRLTIRKRFE